MNEYSLYWCNTCEEVLVDEKHIEAPVCSKGHKATHIGTYTSTT